MKAKPTKPVEGVSRRIVAEHEAAHAVMRRLVFLPATAISINDKGDGFCAGTGKPIDRKADLLLTLAGIAWENECRPRHVFEWEENLGFTDIGEAWQMVSNSDMIRIYMERDMSVSVQDPSQTLDRFFNRAGDMLRPHRRIIEDLGDALHKTGFISARRVAAKLRAICPSEARRIGNFCDVAMSPDLGSPAESLKPKAATLSKSNA